MATVSAASTRRAALGAVETAAAAAGTFVRGFLAAIRAGLLSLMAAAAVVVGVAVQFGGGWPWIVGGVLGMLLSADWRAGRRDVDDEQGTA